MSGDATWEPVEDRIAIVGPCASGKSELVRRLKALGYDARHVGQDHSYVPDMWRRLTRPEVLVYLDVSLTQLRLRRTGSYTEEYLAEQHRRLEHARKHAEIYVHTDPLDPEEVCGIVRRELDRLGIYPISARRDSEACTDRPI